MKKNKSLIGESYSMMDNLKRIVLEEMEQRLRKELLSLRKKLLKEGYKEDDIDTAVIELMEDGEL